MEDMIRKIVYADNEAKALEEATLKEKEALENSIDEECKKIYDEYMNEALVTAEKNDDLEEKSAEERSNEVQQKQKSARTKLTADYERNCDKWVDEIVERVLN